MTLPIIAALISIVTAYCPCKICCNHTHGITKSGHHVEEDITAACGNQLYGKVIWIETVGVRFCEDKGSRVQGNRVDLYFPYHQRAIEFGKKKLEVIILGDWLKNAQRQRSETK